MPSFYLLQSGNLLIEMPRHLANGLPVLGSLLMEYFLPVSTMRLVLSSLLVWTLILLPASRLLSCYHLLLQHDSFEDVFPLQHPFSPAQQPLSVLLRLSFALPAVASD